MSDFTTLLVEQIRNTKSGCRNSFYWNCWKKVFNTITSEEAASAEVVAGNLLPEPGMDPGYIPISYTCLRACEFYTTTAPHHTKERPSNKKVTFFGISSVPLLCRIDTTVKWVVVCIEVEDLYGT